MSILSTSSKLVRVGDSYSAGEGISIENNTISVTGDYGHAYSAGDNITISDDHIISSKDWSSDIDTAVQNVSAETTAWVSEQGYITDADMSDYALVTDVETTSGLLKMDIDSVSGSLSGKMDSSAFSDWQNGQYENDIAGLTNRIETVSGVVDNLSATIEGLDIPTHQEIENASANAYSQSTAWVDSQGYLTAHQDISNLATKNEVDTVSSFLSGAIDYVSANAGDEFPASANDAITAYQNASGTYLTAHQDISNKLDTTAFSTVSGTFLTAHQDISNKLDTTAFSTVSGTFLTAVDLSNYYTKSETSGATELANAFANIPAGDVDVNAYVQNNSATIDNVNSVVNSRSDIWNNAAGDVETFTRSSAGWDSTYNTVNTNSASWGGGSTGDMSAYVPFSANNLAFLGTKANYKNSAVGSNAFAHGNLNFASAMSLAQGYGNIAGWQSLAQGGSCSSYICSLAQGTHCYASAYSLAQGDNCYASAHSFAQGTYCTAESFSISNGNSNFANDYSQAFGRYNHITNSGMVIGAFNKTSSDVSFVIGNGSANTARSDSFVVYHNGSVSAAGNVSANGHELPIVEYVSNSAAATGTNILYVVTGSN